MTMRLLLMLALLSAPWAAQAQNEHYVGIAYAPHGGAERYREEHWVVRDHAQQERLVPVSYTHLTLPTKRIV